MRRLESNFADLHVTLQLFLTQQANMQAPNVLPSISNPASEDSRTTPIPETPRERVSSTTDTRHIKPSSPNEFGGDRTKGRAFLNSCELYTALAPHQFADDQAKIMWALSFMKSGRAARFVERQMRDYHNVGSLSYGSWQEFVDEFIAEFCPKNEVQTSRTDLETTKFFQGGRNVDEYVDDFREIVQRSRYFEGAHIVLKFRQGLDEKIQDHVACLTEGRPSDDSPQQWYAAAILCDENRIANQAFRAYSRIAPTPPNTSSVFRKPPPRVTTLVPPASRFTPPTSSVSGPPRVPTMFVGTSAPPRPKDATGLVCFRCGEGGHSRPQCPRRFDVRFMDFEERQSFAQDAFAALDVRAVEQRASEAAEEKEENEEDFGEDNE
jgi:hypothetical protein